MVVIYPNKAPKSLHFDKFHRHWRHVLRFEKAHRCRDFLHRGLGLIANVESHKNPSLIGLRGALVHIGKNSLILASRGRPKIVPRRGAILAFGGVYALDGP